MKILIIDNNSDRYTWHENFWLNNYPEYNLDIRNKLSDAEIAELDCDLIIVHANNEEYTTIEELENCTFTRVFFSGGFNCTKSFKNKVYYVAQKNLFKLLKDDLIKK